MTTQNPPSGAPSPAPDDDQVDEQPEPIVAPEPFKFAAPKGAKDTGRYSAYDTTLGRYVGGVHDSKAKARDAAKADGIEGDRVEVVEV